MNPGLLCTIACIGVVSLFALDVSKAEPPPGNYTFKFEHDGRERSYIVHVPRDIVTNPWPVLLNFHGSGSSAAGQQAYSHMDETSDREGFLAVYPNGTGMFGNRLLTWNAGTCCGYALNNKVDDVGFVHALIDDLEKHTDIDRARIYATGLSNGAMMTYQLAGKAPELIAAIAPVAGAQFDASVPAQGTHGHPAHSQRRRHASVVRRWAWTAVSADQHPRQASRRGRIALTLGCI